MAAEPERGVPTGRVKRADRCELPISDAELSWGVGGTGRVLAVQRRGFLAKNCTPLRGRGS